MKTQASFDVIVIGAGLSGLSIAWALKRSGLHVAVLEGSEQALGTHHSIQLGPCQLDNGFALVTDDENTRQAVEWLRTLGLNMSSTIVPQSLWTYDNGQMKTWKTFRDDQQVEAIDAFSPFMLPNRLSLSHTFYEMGEWFKAQLEGVIQYRQLVTKVTPAEAGAFVYVGNKEKPWYAHTVIYTGDLTDLSLILPEDLIGQRMRQHLKRPKAWSMLSLDMLHGQAIEEDTHKLFILDSSTGDELAPLWGYFMPAQCPTESTTSVMQVSRWVSFLPDADAEDADQSSQLIKKMKKQIRRAFPKIEELPPLTERITLLPGHSGTFVDSSIKDGQYLKSFPALKLASSRLSPWAGLWRWAERAMTISQSVLEEGIKRSAYEQSPLTMETGLFQL